MLICHHNYFRLTSLSSNIFNLFLLKINYKFLNTHFLNKKNSIDRYLTKVRIQKENKQTMTKKIVINQRNGTSEKQHSNSLFSYTNDRLSVLYKATVSVFPLESFNLAVHYVSCSFFLSVCSFKSDSFKRRRHSLYNVE